MTDQQLIGLLKDDPENGLLKIMEFYGGAIKTICMSILRDCSKEDIEEAISDSLVSIWKSKDNFNSARGTSFKSYCYGITRKNALAKRKEVLAGAEIIPLEEDILVEQDSFANELEKREEENILHEVISTLEEPERSIFILRYFYCFKVKEVASRLQVSEKKVENCLCRGKQRLKSELMQRGIER